MDSSGSPTAHQHKSADSLNEAVRQQTRALSRSDRRRASMLRRRIKSDYASETDDSDVEFLPPVVHVDLFNVNTRSLVWLACLDASLSHSVASLYVKLSAELPCAASLSASVMLSESADGRSLSACNSLSNLLVRASHSSISSDLVTDTSRQTDRQTDRQGQKAAKRARETENSRETEQERQARDSYSTRNAIDPLLTL